MGRVAISYNENQYYTISWRYCTPVGLAHDVSVDGYGPEPVPTAKNHLSDITCLLGKLRIEDVAHLDQKTLTKSPLSDHIISDHINEDVLKSCLKYSKEVEKLSREKKPVSCRRRRPRQLPDIPHITTDPVVPPRVRSPVNTFSLAAELQQIGASYALGKNSSPQSPANNHGIHPPHSIHDQYEEDTEDSSSDQSQNAHYPSSLSHDFGQNAAFIDEESQKHGRRWKTSSRHATGGGGDDCALSGTRRGGHYSTAAASSWTREKAYFLQTDPVTTDSLCDVGELEATHRGCHKFVPRHAGEMFIEIGDPIYVEIEADDLWCEGINLRSRKRGIFPAAYATDLSFLETDELNKLKPRKFHVRFLGSIEVNYHKGNDILTCAINQVTLSPQSVPPQRCCLEVNEYGIKMTDESTTDSTLNKDATSLGTKSSITQRLMKMLSKERTENCNDHFFSLKNISFCGYHPTNNRYFGFITKHPLDMRFACHVFLSETSTVNISEAVGDSFRRFYQQYMALVHPTEDIYLE